MAIELNRSVIYPNFILIDSIPLYDLDRDITIYLTDFLIELCNLKEKHSNNFKLAYLEIINNTKYFNIIKSNLNPIILNSMCKILFNLFDRLIFSKSIDINNNNSSYSLINENLLSKYAILIEPNDFTLNHSLYCIRNSTIKYPKLSFLDYILYKLRLNKTNNIGIYSKTTWDNYKLIKKYGSTNNPISNYNGYNNINNLSFFRNSKNLINSIYKALNYSEDLKYIKLDLDLAIDNNNKLDLILDNIYKEPGVFCPNIGAVEFDKLFYKNNKFHLDLDYIVFTEFQRCISYQVAELVSKLISLEYDTAEINLEQIQSDQYYLLRNWDKITAQLPYPLDGFGVIGSQLYIKLFHALISKFWNV